MTERELSTRQAESPSDRAESTHSYISIRNLPGIKQANHDQEEGKLTSEADVNKSHKGKSREIMRHNKHRGWYEMPETSEDEKLKSAKTMRKKTLEKRRSELRERSRKKRNTASAAKSRRERDVSQRKRRTKTKRRKQTTSGGILIVKHQEKEVDFEVCNSSVESVRPLESSLSVRFIARRCDAYLYSGSSRTSVHPDSSSSVNSEDKNNKKCKKIDMESGEEEQSEMSEEEPSRARADERNLSGVSRSTYSSRYSKTTNSESSRHPSSKWAYRTKNFHRQSSSEGSIPSPRRISLDVVSKKKRLKKKYPEFPIVRGIPRVIRRVKTETLLMAGRSILSLAINPSRQGQTLSGMAIFESHCKTNDFDSDFTFFIYRSK